MAKEDGVYAMRYASQQMLIDKLQQENQQLNEDIKVLFKENYNKEEVINRYEDNWNKLKEYIQEICCYDEVGLRIIDPSYLEDKNAELEKGISDVED